ncbi:hypothetical protein RB2150_09714 [Rhodobacterales bacterium HTCC2150]|nr:hypothetical protein RB2150_09714 [Rhodobacterales bacterium HTCC2150] [Rhodobacteraceae bacterium HTCC2150]
MTQVADRLDTAVIGVADVTTLEGLSAIHQPHCAAAVFRRQHSDHFVPWIAALDPSQLPSARVVLQPNKVRSALEHLCEIAETPACTQRDAFIEDVTKLATSFARTMNAPYVRFRLDVVTTNACRKFHIDALTARLICTYRGTGTQYGTATDTSDPEHINTVPTGSPIVLRGTRWPENPASKLLHRSPPIEGTGASRLVLVLDPV